MKTLNLTQAKNVNFQKIQETLANFSYNRVSLVLEPGEWAVRGNIIDVFPVNHSHPIRIEFDDNTIDRLMSFNLHTQRSISKLNKTTILPVDDSDHPS